MLGDELDDLRKGLSTGEIPLSDWSGRGSRSNGRRMRKGQSCLEKMLGESVYFL